MHASRLVSVLPGVTGAYGIEIGILEASFTWHFDLI
jgi:hypothetical protein